jgi:hypothetical protein
MVKENRKWTIRGIVSAALKSPEGCDLENYVVFTDVAKNMDWINRNM